MKLTNPGKTAKVIIFLFVVAIIFSFAVTGIQTDFSGGPDTVAKVDGTPVKVGEYQRALQAQLDRYSQAFGGKPLTSQQIKMFRIRETVLDGLISNKIWINITDDMEIYSSKSEIKESIKEMPVFNQDNIFNVNLYKNLLRANGLTTTGFEEQVAQDRSVQKVFSLIRNIALPTAYISDVEKFKKMGATASAVKIEKQDLIPFIEVSNKEITDILNDKSKESLLQGEFNAMRGEFNKPAEVKARHILIKGKDDKTAKAKAEAIRKKVTPKNFAKIAGKETEDPSGKGKKGGSLGWFGKGRMVPEFEDVAFSLKPGSISKPVKTQFGYHIIYVEDKKAAVTKKFEDVKRKVAKRHLQRVNTEKRDELYKTLLDQIESAFNAGKAAKVKSLAKKYDLEIFNQTELSFLDQKIGTISLSNEDMKQLFNQDKPIDLLKKPIGSATALVKVHSRKLNIKDLTKEELDKAAQSQNSSFTSTLTSQIVEKVKEKSTIVKYDRML
jgi:peptidyl-prolyl cis-trans isomerase D